MFVSTLFWPLFLNNHSGFQIFDGSNGDRIWMYRGMEFSAMLKLWWITRYRIVEVKQTLLFDSFWQKEASDSDLLKAIKPSAQKYAYYRFVRVAPTWTTLWCHVSWAKGEWGINITAVCVQRKGRGSIHVAHIFLEIVGVISQRSQRRGGYSLSTEVASINYSSPCGGDINVVKIITSERVSTLPSTPMFETNMHYRG